MSLNKYGEIVENPNCTGCNNPIKDDWVACPHCGSRLDDANSAADDYSDDGDSTHPPVLDAAKREQVRKLLTQLDSAVSDYEKESEYSFGKGFAALMGLDNSAGLLESMTSLRKQIYDVIDDFDVWIESSFDVEIHNLSQKKKPTPNDVISVFRDDICYLKNRLAISA